MTDNTINFGSFKEKVGEELEKDKLRFQHQEYRLKQSSGYGRFQELNFTPILKSKDSHPYPKEKDD